MHNLKAVLLAVFLTVMQGVLLGLGILFVRYFDLGVDYSYLCGIIIGGMVALIINNVIALEDKGKKYENENSTTDS